LKFTGDVLVVAKWNNVHSEREHLQPKAAVYTRRAFHAHSYQWQLLGKTCAVFAESFPVLGYSTRSTQIAAVLALECTARPKSMNKKGKIVSVKNVSNYSVLVTIDYGYCVLIALTNSTYWLHR